MVVLLMMIGIGGAAGAYGRYRFAGWVYSRTGADFPWGTLAVNLSGSLLLGLLLPFLDLQASMTAVRGFLTVGCIGAFTTFSTFAYEATTLIRDGQRLRAGLYVAASLGLGLLSIALGLHVARLLL
jgi:fluoride exporter